MPASDDFVRLKLQRHKLFDLQQGRCIYCDCDMWIDHSNKGMKRFRDKHHIRADTQDGILRMSYQMATIEHMRRRADRGSNKNGNLLLACAYCNSSRQERTPEKHYSYIQTLIDKGAHPCWSGLGCFPPSPIPTNRKSVPRDKPRRRT